MYTLSPTHSQLLRRGGDRCREERDEMLRAHLLEKGSVCHDRCACVCVCVFMCVFMFVFMCVCVYVYIYIYMCVSVCAATRSSHELYTRSHIIRFSYSTHTLHPTSYTIPQHITTHTHTHTHTHQPPRASCQASDATSSFSRDSCSCVSA
jgi:hypothetical protein